MLMASDSALSTGASATPFTVTVRLVAWVCAVAPFELSVLVATTVRSIVPEKFAAGVTVKPLRSAAVSDQLPSALREPALSVASEARR